MPPIKPLILRNIYLFSFFGLSFSSLAQRTAPSAYTPTRPMNYVRTWDAKGPQIDGAKIQVAASVDSFNVTTQYFDELGRPLQLVIKQQSPLKKDRVSASIYDEYGREQFLYLPFVANTTGGNTSTTDGLMKRNPFQQDSVFYRSADPSSPLYGQGQTYLYSQTVFENIPTSRPIKSMSAGNSWVGTLKGVDNKYELNSFSDSVRRWKVTINPLMGSWSTYATDSAYRPGMLERITVIDEAGNRTVEYKDTDGKTLLRKVQLSAMPSSGHAGWLCTYYIYDDNQQLRCVIQPRGVQLLQSNTWNINGLSGAILNEQCFRYEYDAESQMIVKKVPGAGRVFIVYDARGRVAMTQDSLQRTGTAKWLVTFYDAFNRPIQTGLLNNSSISNRTIEQHWSTAANLVDYPFSMYSNPGSGYEELTRTGYDHYDSLPTGAQNGVLKTTYINTSNFEQSYNVSPIFAQAIEQSLAVKGLVTWQKVKVLASSPATYLYSTTLYDGKGRAIQIKSTNITGGTDVVTNQYSFSGQLIRSHLEHQKSGSAADIYQVVTINSYDHAGRLLKVSKKVNATGTNNTTAKVIVENVYDELGQLKTKKIGANPSAPTMPLETLTYDYNIRGWVLGANRSYVKSIDSTISGTYFGFDLGYDQSSFTVGSSNTSYTTP